MTWIPVKGNDAIEQVRVVLRFSDPLPGKFFDNLIEQFKDSMKEFDLNNQSIQPSGGGVEIKNTEQATEAKRSSLVIFDKLDENDRKIIHKSLFVNRIEVAYSTSEYSHWSLFKKQYEPIIGKLLNIVGTTVDVSLLALEYWDRFISEEPDEIANPVCAIPSLEGQIANDAVSNNKNWHLHKGWFEASEKTKKDILVQQNLDGAQAIKNQTNDFHRSIGIHNACTYRTIDKNCESRDLLVLLDELHEVSKRIFKEIITEELQKLVNIGD